MKSLIIMLCLVFSNCYCEPRFLWQEEGKILWYKTLTLESSICLIDSYIKELKRNPERLEEILEKIQNHVDNCKNTLGFPGEI